MRNKDREKQRERKKEGKRIKRERELDIKR